MKYSAIILCILDMLNVALPGSLSWYNPDRYPRHNFRIMNEPTLPRVDSTFRVFIASTALGLSSTQRQDIQPQYHWPLYFQNNRCHNFKLPSLKYCKEWTGEFFGYVTNYQKYQHNRCFRQKLLEQYPYYTCPGFVEMLKTFPEYEQHIQFVAQQIRQSNTWNLYARWHGIDKIVNNFEQEVRHTRHQRQEIKAIKDALDKQLAHQRDALEDLYNTYEHEPEAGLVGQHQAERAAHGKPLLHATDNREFFGQSYRLKDKTHALLKKHSVESKAIAEFNSCFGTKLQQSVHQEFIYILDGLAAPNRTHRFHDLDKLVIDFATIGVQANKTGKITHAYSLADFCWAALDFTQAVGEGVLEGAQQTANTFLHPIDTATNMGKGLGTLGYHLGKVLYELGDIGVTAYYNPQEGRTKWENYVERTKALCSALEQKIRSIPPRDLVRTGVAFATETFLTGKCLGAVHKFAHASHVKALNLARKAHAGEVVATTAEGIQFRLANKAAKTFSKMESSCGKVADVAKKVIPKVANMKEFFELPFGKKIKNLCQKTNLRFKGETIYKITEKANNKYLKQGYHFYLDSLHFDHIEVFGKNGNLKAVLNLDGSLNSIKYKKALDSGRRIHI